MPFDTILFDISDRVACITLNRPEKLNAFTAHMHEELRDALDQVRASEAVRALLVTGEESTAQVKLRAARLGGGAHYLRRVSPHGRDLAQRAQ